MKKIIILVIIIAFLLPIAFSAQITQINTDSNTQLTIVYPKTEYAIKDNDIILRFDILNSNFSKMTNLNTDCLFTAIDNIGEIVTFGELGYNSTIKSWSYTHNKNLSNIGVYNYYVYCNASTGSNGFISSAYQITEDGTQPEIKTHLIAIAIIFIGGVYLLFKFAENIDSEEEWSQPLKLLVNMIAMFILLAVVGWAIRLQQTTDAINPTLTGITTAIFLAVGFVVLPIFIFFLVMFIKHILQFMEKIKTGKDFNKL